MLRRGNICRHAVAFFVEFHALREVADEHMAAMPNVARVLGDVRVKRAVIKARALIFHNDLKPSVVPMFDATTDRPVLRVRVAMNHRVDEKFP